MPFLSPGSLSKNSVYSCGSAPRTKSMKALLSADFALSRVTFLKDKLLGIDIGLVFRYS